MSRFVAAIEAFLVEEGAAGRLAALDRVRDRSPAPATPRGRSRHSGVITPDDPRWGKTPEGVAAARSMEASIPRAGKRP